MKMTDQERINRLEQMVKTLSETVMSLTKVVNTGSHEYSLRDVVFELRDTKEFRDDESMEEPDFD